MNPVSAQTAGSLESPTAPANGGGAWSSPPLFALLGAYLITACVWAWTLYGNLVAHLRFEDALIVLRYARNLARGEGFVFNPGEAVLGVTTPLHTLLSVLYVWIGGERAPQVQNLAGCLALIAGGAALLVLLHRSGFAWTGLFVALLSLGNFHQNYLYFGMETHLFAFLVLVIFALELGGSRLDHERETRRAASDGTAPSAQRRKVLSPSMDFVQGMLLGVAFLVRYDAALLALLIGVRRWWVRRAPPLRLTLTFFAVVTPWLLFALINFGSILPNALLSKEGYYTFGKHLGYVYEHYRVTYQGLVEAFLPGPETGTELGRRLSYWFPLPIAVGIVSAAWHHRRFALIALYLALHLAVYAAIGSDPGFTWHYYLLTPFGYLFLALGFRQLIAALGALLGRLLPSGWRPWGLRLALVAVLVTALTPVLLHLRQQMNYRYQMDPHTTQLYEISAWLREHYPPGTSLLQPSIGVLGYETDFYMVDHAGLVTPGLYFFNDIDATPMVEVVARHSPDLILLSQWSPAQVEPLGYQLVHTFETPFVYRVYERMDDDRPVALAVASRAGDHGAMSQAAS